MDKQSENQHQLQQLTKATEQQSILNQRLQSLVEEEREHRREFEREYEDLCSEMRRETNNIRNLISEVSRRLNTDQNASNEVHDSDSIPTEIISYVQVGNKQPTPVWVDIGPLRITATIGTGTYRTVLQGDVYDRLKPYFDQQNVKLRPVTHLRLKGRLDEEFLKIRGSIEVACRIVSAVGNDFVPLETEFIVVDDANPEALIGMKDLEKYAMEFRSGAITFKQPALCQTITLVDGENTSPDDSEEEISITRELDTDESISSPIITEIVTFMQVGDELPTPIWIEMGPMKITATVSTGTYRTLLSSKVYDQMVKYCRERNIKLKPVTNLRLECLNGQALTIRGSLRMNCRVVSAVGRNYVPLNLEFVVVDNLKPQGIFGFGDLTKHDVFVSHDQLLFQRTNPPRAIALVGSKKDQNKTASSYSKRYRQSRY